MKTQNLLYLIFFAIITSCSKNDEPTIIPIDETPTVGDNVVTTFMPINAMNTWNYATENTVTTPTPTSGTGITTGADVLKVDSEVVENLISYKLMKTLPITPTGFYCNSVNNNKLRVDGSSVKMTGNISFNLGTNVLNFGVTDFVLFKENALVNTNLGSPSTGSTILTIPPSTIPINVNYTIKAVSGGDSSPITIGTTTYNNIKIVKLYVTIDASINLGANSAQVFNPTMQDVIISTQYYAKNIGVIKADTKIEYHLSSIIGSLAPTIPVDGLSNVSEKLTSKNF